MNIEKMTASAIKVSGVHISCASGFVHCSMDLKDFCF